MNLAKAKLNTTIIVYSSFVNIKNKSYTKLYVLLDLCTISYLFYIFKFLSGCACSFFIYRTGALVFF